jgi:hypothetical protein
MDMPSSHIILFSRILRWSLGVLFIGVGVLYRHDDGWPAILFGGAFIVSGFFRPRRCMDDGCSVEQGGNKG